MAKVIVEGVEVEESELTDFQRELHENPPPKDPEVVYYSNKVPSKIDYDLKPIYEVDENYVFTGRSMPYFKTIENDEPNDPLFERWTPTIPMSAPVSVTEKATGVTTVTKRVKVKKGEESKLNKLAQRVIWEYVVEE